MLKTTATHQKCPLYLFTVAGRRRYNPQNLNWENVGGGAAESFGLLQYAQELRGGGLIVLEDCVLPLRDQGGDPRMRMALIQMLSDETDHEGLVLVFLEPPESESHLPAILADQFVRLDVAYPRIRELDFIARKEIAITAHRSGKPMEADRVKQEAKRLSPGMVGLTRSAARDALRDALAPNPGDFKVAFEHLQNRKKRQLSRELAMSVLDTAGMEEPIGLDYLLEYLTTVKEKIRQFGPQRARGILLIGPPGTGKTMLARTIGKMVGLPVVEFKIASLMNSLLGETENRFARAFATLEAMAPNVVFIDEIEKAFGDSSERDGGTMMRCTGSLLSWLSDNPYSNFIIATSNSLRRMGEIGLTMTRSERFDASFFVDVPSLESRQKMLKRWIIGKMAKQDKAIGQLAEITEKFSGADLRSVVKHAAAISKFRNVDVCQEILKIEIEKKRSRALAIYDEFQDLRRWGKLFCDPAGPTDS
jgi:SpoVK/Ycf46/Vps4 family AAA+-type ATPase